ncbi:MAG: 50S ribosomal protein L29 [Mycoplasma sp.]
MANNMINDLRKKTNAELAELIAKCKEQLLQIRFNIANGEAEKLHVIPEIRKTIAKSLTILNERSIASKENETANSKKGTVNND